MSKLFQRKPYKFPNHIFFLKALAGRHKDTKTFQYEKLSLNWKCVLFVKYGHLRLKHVQAMQPAITAQCAIQERFYAPACTLPSPSCPVHTYWMGVTGVNNSHQPCPAFPNGQPALTALLFRSVPCLVFWFIIMLTCLPWEFQKISHLAASAPLKMNRT